jgi:hypothetical protein
MANIVNMETIREYLPRMTRLVDIASICQFSVERLEACGVKTEKQLLKHGGTAAGRFVLARESGLAETQLKGWVNRAGLGRVDGMCAEYIELLDWVGVDSLADLGRCEARRLHCKLSVLNADKRLVVTVPEERQLEEWIQQAKELQTIIEY